MKCSQLIDEEKSSFYVTSSTLSKDYFLDATIINVSKAQIIK